MGNKIENYENKKSFFNKDTNIHKLRGTKILDGKTNKEGYRAFIQWL